MRLSWSLIHSAFPQQVFSLPSQQAAPSRSLDRAVAGIPRQGSFPGAEGMQTGVRGRWEWPGVQIPSQELGWGDPAGIVAENAHWNPSDQIRSDNGQRQGSSADPSAQGCHSSPPPVTPPKQGPLSHKNACPPPTAACQPTHAPSVLGGGPQTLLNAKLTPPQASQCTPCPLHAVWHGIFSLVSRGDLGPAPQGHGGSGTEGRGSRSEAGRKEEAGGGTDGE